MADIPYHSSVDPIVPDASRSLAPEIILKGLAAMAQMTVAREKMQLEGEEMATDAMLKSRQLDIARENNMLDYQVGLQNVGALQQSRLDTLDFKQRNLDETIRHHTAIENYRNDPTNPASLAGRAKAAALKEADFADFAKEASPLIDDPNPKNPVDYYAKFQRLQDAWQFSGDTRVKNALKQIKVRTEQHSVPIKFGRTLNAAKQWEGGGNTKNIPVGQIIEGLKDPDRNEETMRLLESNGMTVKGPIRETGFDVIGRKERSNFITEWLLGKPTQKQTVREETISPRISTYAKMSAGVDFSRGEPRPARTAAPEANGAPETVAPSITQSSVDEAAQTMADEQAPLPTSDIFPPTETDKVLAQARRAAAKPGANIEGIKAALQAKGIDPELLDAETQ